MHYKIGISSAKTIDIMGMQGTEIWAKQPLGRHNFLLMQQYNLVKILAAWEMRIEHPLLTGLNYTSTLIDV